MSGRISLYPPEDLPVPEAGLVSDLGRIVGIEAIAADLERRIEASTDMWPKGFLWRRQGLLPRPVDAVLYPGDAEEIARIVRFAGERGVGLVPVGARSGVCGGLIPSGERTLAVDLRRLRGIGRADGDRLRITAEAGVLGTELEGSLREEGFTLGHFPSSIGCSSVGGWIATRSAGQSSSRYGKIEDMVVALECVLGTGAIVRPSRPARGIDWVEIFAGSEGTLGFIASATLRIWPAPDAVLPRARRFPSLRLGLGAMREILRAGLRPSVMRLYDPFDSLVSLRGRREERGPPGLEELRPGETRPLPLRGLWERALSRPRAWNLLAGLPPSCLLILVHEGEGWEAEAEAREAAAICERWGGSDSGEEPARRWMARRWDVSRKLPRVYEAGAWTDTMEVAIGWGGIERLHRAVRRAVAPHAFVMAHFSHAYPDGCSIYFTFLGAAQDPGEGISSYETTWEAALAAARREGATLSHHHGVGLLKAPWLEGEIGARGIGLLGALRRLCDPAGVCNPGKLVG